VAIHVRYEERTAAGAPLTMTMNVSGGFAGALVFYDIAI
jgi:hypothetical protein